MVAAVAYSDPPDQPSDPIVHRGDRYQPEPAGTKSNYNFWFGPYTVPPGHDPNRIDVRATIGTIERWTIVNASSEQHPFHMHTDYFQVVSVNGHPYGARSLQDTVNVPADGRAVILVQFHRLQTDAEY